MAAGIMIIRWGHGDPGPWLETVGQTLVIAANVVIWYPLELVFLQAIERRTRRRRTAWLQDMAIHVSEDSILHVGAGGATIDQGVTG
jgi:hypothetical protein